MKNETFEVFYIDDSPSDRLLFKGCMEDNFPTATLQEFSSGLAALEILRKQISSPGFIFLDINMPVVNGFECLLEIRGIRKYDATPVIMYTTSDVEKDIEQSYASGANLFITKPWQLQNQIAVLQTVFTMDWSDYFPKPVRKSFLLNFSEVKV